MIPYSIYAGGSPGAAGIHRAGVNANLVRLFKREYFPTIANNGTDAEHDLDIGAARLFVEDGSGNSAFVEFDAETIAIDGAGLDTGTVANNTWYYVWAFWNPTTGDSLYKLSASATSPTAPSGYTYKRFLCDEIAAAVLTDGSANILGGRFNKKRFEFNAAITEFTAASQPASSTARNVSSPSGIKCFWIGYANLTNNTNAASTYVIQNFDSGSNAALYRTQVVNLASPSFSTKSQATNGQIKHLANDSLLTVQLLTSGYEVF